MSKGGHRETIGRLTQQIGGDVKATPASEGDLAAMGISVEHVPKAVSST